MAEREIEEKGRALCVGVEFCLLRVLFFVSRHYGLQRNPQGGLLSTHLWYV